MSQEQAFLNDYYEGAKACADVLNVMVTIMRDKVQYRHGLTKDEVAQFFPLVKHYRLKTYDNRQRDLYKKGLAGKHKVHGEMHYFPIGLDEEGVVVHDGCCECIKPKEVMST